MKSKLPKKIKVFYALGQLGWSILASIISTWLMYFYLPPEDAGLATVIPQGGIFLGITVIGLVMGLGIFVDAITDPWIANISDKSKNPKGRRIPFMKRGALPFSVLAVLVFFVPFQNGVHVINSLWLIVVLPLYYVGFTYYVIPYSALMGELGESNDDRIDLSTYISITWFLGLVIATFAPNLWNFIMSVSSLDKPSAIRVAFMILAFIAFILMMIPSLTIDETKYTKPTVSTLDIKDSIRAIYSDKNFRYFVYSEFGYWLSNGFFQTSLVYYITVLALQHESDVGLIITIVGVLSFLQYPLINKLSKKYGKKRLMIISFIFLILSFAYVATIGLLPISGFMQLVPIIILFSVPSAITGILPNAIIADCAVANAHETKENKEALYFGMRSFLNKLGATMAAIILPSLLALGKSVDNDIGIRLSVIVAAIIVVVSLAFFLRYDEKEVLSIIHKHEGNRSEN